MPSGSRLALVALLAVLVLGPMAAHPVAAAASGPATASPAVASDGGFQAVASPTPPPYNTTLAIDLAANGDARWHVTTTFNLSDQADRDAFDQLATEFQQGDASSDWLAGFQQARVRASEAVDRQMRIHSVEPTSEPPENETGPGTGRLTLSFTWTNFAAVTDGGQQLEVGDVFAEPEPPLLAELQAGQTLVITPPNGFSPVTGSGDFREGSFYWEGPTRFADNPPAVVYAGNGGLPTTLLASLAVVGLLGVLLVGYLFVNRRSSDDGSEETGGATTTATPVEADVADDPEAAATTGDEDDGEDGVDVELLSDEERVERLLDQNGGRMKQATIVKETGWSNAKVSQLLSAMEDADRIDKLRIGRENLISFPDEDVADVEE